MVFTIGSTLGAKNINWKGHRASYDAIHKWLRRHHGKATHCIECKRPGLEYEWANVSGAYKRDISDYRPMCTACHPRMDAGASCRRGHLLTPTNAYMPRGTKQRGCRICRRISQQNYKIRHS